jgi:hypothetical protein
MSWATRHETIAESQKTDTHIRCRMYEYDTKSLRALLKPTSVPKDRLDKKTNEQLVDLANTRGVDIPDSAKSKKRKRVDKVERKADKKTVVQRAVKKKLGGVCRSPPLVDFIQTGVRSMTQMAVEASRLCNLHVLRMLEEGEDIDIPSDSFFRNALCLVSDVTSRCGGPVADRWLEETFLLHYLPSRPPGMPFPSRDGLRQAVTIQSQQMERNAKTMVSHRLYGRLRKLMKLFVVRATLRGGAEARAFESRHSYPVVSRAANQMMDGLVKDGVFTLKLKRASPLTEVKVSILFF